jgi:gliding motility-associated-like protein
LRQIFINIFVNFACQKNYKMKRILLFAALMLLSGLKMSSQNLLANSGFENGSSGSGFLVSGAGYTQISAPFSGTTVAGNYAVTSNPAPLNASYIAGTDHSGTGKMLIVDGLGSNAGQPFFWEAGNVAGGPTCGLTAGKTYVFSYWIKSVGTTVTNSATQADIRVAVTNATGVTLQAGNALAPLPAAGWQKVTYIFTASAACVNIGLWNNNTSFAGNDFAIDDVALVPVASIASTIGVCLNDPNPLITFTANVGTPPYTFTYTINTGGNLTVASATNTATVSAPTNVAGTFTYNLVSLTQTATATTYPASGSAVVYVSATPATISLTSPSATANQKICIGATIVPITYTLGNSGGASVTGLPPGVSGSFNSGTGVYTLTGTPLINGVYNYTVSAAGCGNPAANGTITIYPPQTQINLTSAAATTNQTICATDPITPITYTVADGATGATVAGLPLGVTGSFNPSTGIFTISGAPDASVSGTFNYTATTTGGCSPSSLTGTLIVDPVAQINLTSAAGTNSQTLCVNNPIATITYATVDATGATVTGLPPGVTGSYAGGVVTINGTPTANGTYNYTVTATGCGNPTATGTINVPNLTALIFGSTTIMAGESASITFFGTPNATVFFTSSLGNNSVVLDSQGNGSYNIPYISATTTFTLTSITSATTPSCSAVVNGTATITVNNNTCNIPLVEVSIDTPSPVCNVGECTELLAHFSNIGYTTDYIVSPIPYCPSFPFTGGTVINAVGDDTWSPVVTLPFDFNFYGACFDQVLVGTNGVITFDLVNQVPLGYCNWPFTATIPNAAFPIRNAIYGVYQDTNIASPPVTNTAIQNVNYYVLDTGPNAAPNRVFVANFNELPQFQCNAGVGFQTSQIVIHETTNIIEIFVNKRTSCTTWNSGSGLIGIQNQSGSLATVPPGRNTGTWSATNEAWRFLPKNIPPIPTTIQWFQGPTPIGAVNQNPVSVCPTGPTTYTALVTYTNCAIVQVDEDILVDVVPPLPVADPTNVFICTTAAGPYTVDINQTAAMLTGLPNPSDYWIKYYLDEQDAKDDAFNNIPPGTLSSYVTNGPFPLTIYVRIEDLVSTGCYNIRPLVIDVGGPSGTISYPGTPYCNNLAVPQPVTATNLTTGGTYSAVSVPPGNTLIINPTTGAITPNGSPVGNYDVTYNIAANPPCPAYSTSAAVAIIACTCTVNASSLAETLCVNTALTPITYTNVGATSASITAGSLPPGVMGSFAAGVFTVSGTPTTAGVYTITVGVVTPTDTCYATTTITVNGNSTITLASPAATTNQTVCINTAITAINYTIANGGTGATVTGLPAGVTGIFAGGTFSITGTPTVAGTFNYTVTTTGGCSSANLSGTIIVNPNVTIVLTSPVATTNQTICINTPITNIVYTVGNGATGATVLGLPTGVAGSFAAGVFTISGTPSAAGTFNYTVTTTGGCSSASLTGTIIVNPNATISQTSAAGTEAQTVCINTAIASIIYAVANGGTGATVSGLPPGVTGTYAAGTFTIAGTPTTVGTYNYTVTTTGGCSSASLSGSIIVSPNVTIALTSAAATANQTVCINTAITNIVYTTTNGATNVTVTGLPAGVSGTFAAGVFTISGTPTAAGPFNYTVTTVGGCSTATLNGTITVNPNATISLTSAATTANQTVCINTAITQITYTVANGATGATATGLPAGITGVFNAGTGEFNINGSSATTGTFNYTVTTTGGCSSASLNGTIIVSPNVTIALTSAATTANQTVCIASAIATITYTIANSATGVTATGFPTGVTGSYNAATGVYTITGTPSVDGVFNYNLTTVGGCGTATIGGTITVNPAATIALTSAIGTDAQTVCINTAITAIQYTIGNGGTGATVLGLPAGVTGTYAGGLFTITGTPTAAGTFNYTVTTTGGCSSSSLTGTIIVNPNVTIALTSAVNTDNQTVCINTPITNIVYTIANNATGATETGMPPGVSGSFAAGVYTITGTPTSAGTYNYTITTTGGCSVANATGTIIVNPNATIGQLSPAGTETQTLCINTPITSIGYLVGNGAAGAAATGLPTGVTGTFNSGTGVFTISGTPTVAGTFPINITTTGGCSSATLTATLTVNPNVTMTLTSATGTDNQTVCINAAITSIVYTVGNGGTGATVAGLPLGIAGVYNAATNTFTISGSTLLVGTYNYSVTTSGGCSSVTLNGTIIISPDVTITLTSAAGTDNQTVCINTPITPIAYTTANNATGVTTAGLPAGVTGAFNSTTHVFTLTGSPTVAGTFNYTVTTTGGCGSDFLTGIINVNPNATIALTSAAATANQTVCISTPIANIVYTVANGATGAGVIGLPAGVTGTFGPGNTFTISGTPTVAGTFNYTVTTTGGCASASLTGTIIVNPNVTIALTSANNNQTVCINTAIASITYAIANSGAAGATITGLPTGLTGSYNAGVYTISGAPTVAGTFNYTVTTSGGCSSAFLTGTIVVNPNVTIALTTAGQDDQTVCINTPITPVVFTVGNLATGASITSGGLPLGVTGVYNAASGTFTISGTPTSAGTFNYEVSTSGGCSVAILPGVIKVTPNATLTLTSSTGTTNQTICQNTAIAPITYLPGTGPTGATGATVTGLPPGITGSFDATTGVFTISGTAAAATLGIFNYQVTTTGGCSFAQLGGVIEVTPSASIALTSAVGTDGQQICEIQESLVDIEYTVGDGATGASIVTGTVPVGISGSFNAANGTFTISGTPTESGTFTYTVRTSGGCSYSEITGTIRVNPLPIIALPTDGFICVDENGLPKPGSTFVLTSGLPLAGYTFEWSDVNGVIPGAVSNNLTVSAPGVYSVTVTNNSTGCFSTQSTTVISSYPPLSVKATASQYFSQEQVVTVVALPIGNYEYQVDNGPWQDGNQFFNLPSGEHHFLVRDKIGCGELPTSLIIIDYPKFFTPNGDGYNDTWNIDDLNLLTSQETSRIEIFDRYGKLIKEISPKGKGWDGTLNGYPLPSTDYWFKVYYNEDGAQREFKAHFSLKR